MLTLLLLTVVSYLIGAVPVAYLAGRLLSGIDLRRYGSGNVGASNVFQSVAGWAVVPVGLIEISQGMAGIGLAKLLDQEIAVQVVVGLAAVMGQTWSVYLGLTGGRGIGPSIGFMLYLAPPVLVAFTLISLAGALVRSYPLTVGLAIALTPIAGLITGSSGPVVAGCFGMAVIVFGKRLLTNRIGLPEGQDWRDLLLNRLLFDRDVREREAWVHRVPRNGGDAR